VGVMRRLMTTAQVGVAVILTIHIALLARTAWRLSALDTGFDPAQLLTFRLNVPAEASRARQVLGDLVEGVARVPGVEAVAIVDRLPIADSEVIRRLTIEGSTESRPELMPTAAVSAITHRYFETMRIPVRRGRSLTMQDFTNVRPVALVNEEAVRKYWPGLNPIDRRVRFNNQEDWFTIVGVVGNVRNSDASSGPLPELYVPASSRPPSAVAVVVRAERGDPLLMVPSLRAAMASIAPTEPIFDVASMNTVIFDDIAGTLILVGVLTIVAVVALCLAASGVYGVVSYSVSQRTREIGVRLALGATPAAVVEMVTRQGLMPVVVGATIGLSMAIALAFLALRPLGDVEVRDPLSYTTVTLSILAIAVIASYLPARRASRLDPMSILRHE
jgi:putative ABC transport system permease protein